MIEKLMAILKFFNEEGVPVPLAKDPARPEASPSVTLFFLHIANTLAIISLIALHFRSDALVATIATCVYGVTWVVLYLMRNLQKAKFDLDDKSFELEGEDEGSDAPKA